VELQYLLSQYVLTVMSVLRECGTTVSVVSVCAHCDERGLLMVISRYCLCNSIGSVTVPVLILHALDDGIVPYDLGLKVRLVETVYNIFIIQK